MRKLEVEKQFGSVLKDMTQHAEATAGTRDAHYNVSHRMLSDNQLEVQIGGKIAEGTWQYSVGGHLIGPINVQVGVGVYMLPLDPVRHDVLPLDQLPGHLVRHD
jgi:hypothetical protein